MVYFVLFYHYLSLSLTRALLLYPIPWPSIDGDMCAPANTTNSVAFFQLTCDVVLLPLHMHKIVVSTQWSGSLHFNLCSSLVSITHNYMNWSDPLIHMRTHSHSFLLQSNIQRVEMCFFFLPFFDIWFPIGAVLPWFSHIFHALTHSIWIKTAVAYSGRQNTAKKIICNVFCAVICQTSRTICVRQRLDEWKRIKVRTR